MRNRNFFLALMIVAAVSSAACEMSSCDQSPTAPSGGSNTPVNVPSDATIHEAPLPGATAPFRWWITSITPGRNSQLVIGQSWSIGIACDAPEGYRYFIRWEFSNGPGGVSGINPDGSMRSYFPGQYGNTNGCSGGASTSTDSGAVGAKTPDLLYVRFSVWIGASGPTPPDRKPDVVVDEFIGWGRQG